MSNIVPLKLQGTSDLTAVSTGLKGIATEAKNAGGPLNTLTKSLDQTEKSTTSLGQKVKSFGSKFGVLTASVGSLAGSMVGLVRQYQDLGDSQIAVEKATRRVSTADVGVKKAKDALTAAIAKYGKGSKEAALKTQELANAESLLSVNTQLLTERQEDHQRAQENFWIGLVPTITSAGGTIMGVLQNMSGIKGFGGLKDSIINATNAIGVGGGGKGGGGKGAGLLGALGAIGGGALAGITGGVAGAGLILQQGFGAADIMKQSGLFADPVKEFEKNAKQQEKILTALHAPSYRLFLDTQNLVNEYKALNPVLDKNGQIMVDVGTKTSAVAPSLGAANTALMSLANTAADWLTKGASLSQVNELVRQSGISLTDQTFVMREAWAEYTIAQKDANQAMADAASRSQYLDANLKPIVMTTGSWTAELAKAETSLAASGRGLSTYNINVLSAKDAIAAFKAQTDANIVSDQVWRDSMNQSITEITGIELSANFTTEQLKLLYAAAAESKAKFAELFATLKKGNPALWETGAAAAVTMTNLVPRSRVTGRGPRNPNFRLRSDYQTPLIGSALSQRQQLAGTRGPGKTHIKIKKAQTGMNEWLSEDTMIMAHKGEHARITPSGRGGGGDNVTVNVYLDGEKLGSNSTLVRKIRYGLNDNSGVMK